MKYMLITTRGFEDIVEQDLLSHFSDIEVIEKSYRKIIFSYPGDTRNLLELRSVEDVFFSISKLEAIGHTRNDLPDLILKIKGLDFSAVIKIIEELRSKKLTHFSISSSSVGKRNYSYIEIKDSLSIPLSSSLNLKYENESHDQFDIRVFLEHQNAYIGVRLSEKPLHRREYKIATTKATLRADIAYCMAFIANISEQDIVLDPMCGSGTILIESAIFRPKLLLGGDINPEAVQISQQNITAFDPTINIKLQAWDATSLPIEDNSIDKILCNLPFGKQIEIVDIPKFYHQVLLEFTRIVKTKSIIVILTSYPDIESIIEQFPNLQISKSLETNLNGEVTKLIVINN